MVLDNRPFFDITSSCKLILHSIRKSLRPFLTLSFWVCTPHSWPVYYICACPLTLAAGLEHMLFDSTQIWTLASRKKSLYLLWIDCVMFSANLSELKKSQNPSLSETCPVLIVYLVSLVFRWDNKSGLLLALQLCANIILVWTPVSPYMIDTHKICLWCCFILSIYIQISQSEPFLLPSKWDKTNIEHLLKMHQNDQ